jgi:hypothetical protein
MEDDKSTSYSDSDFNDSDDLDPSETENFDTDDDVMLDIQNTKERES